MRRMNDPARQARERLLDLERQARTQAEARAVRDGVAETVALARARGAAIEAPEARGGRAQPCRRLTGLEWLVRKGRLSPQAAAVGARYGAAYRRAKLVPTIPSTLNAKPGDSGGPALSEILAHGEGTAAARQRLAGYRRRLMGQADLVGACDAICGEEQTPREAAGGDRDSVRLEAVLKVALDLLA